MYNIFPADLLNICTFDFFLKSDYKCTACFLAFLAFFLFLKSWVKASAEYERLLSAIPEE